MLNRLISGVGAGGTTLVMALQPTMLVPVLTVVTVISSLPLLLITALALIAVYSSDPGRRAVAEKILYRLLSTLRPREPGLRRSRRRRDPAVEK